MLTARHRLPVNDDPDPGTGSAGPDVRLPVPERELPGPVMPPAAVRVVPVEPVTQSLPAVLLERVLPVATTAGQVWVVPDHSPVSLASRARRWTRRPRRVDDDWGWSTRVLFESHADAVRWLADHPGPARLVTELVSLRLPGPGALVGCVRRIEHLVRDLDTRLRADLLLPTRPQVAGATTPAWVSEQVQVIQDELAAPGTAHARRSQTRPGVPLSGDQYRAMRAHLADALVAHHLTEDWVPALVDALDPVLVGWLTHPATGTSTGRGVHGVRRRR